MTRQRSAWPGKATWFVTAFGGGVALLGSAACATPSAKTSTRAPSASIALPPTSTRGTVVVDCATQVPAVVVSAPITAGTRFVDAARSGSLRLVTVPAKHLPSRTVAAAESLHGSAAFPLAPNVIVVEGMLNGDAGPVSDRSALGTPTCTTDLTVEWVLVATRDVRKGEALDALVASADVDEILGLSAFVPDGMVRGATAAQSNDSTKGVFLVDVPSGTPITTDLVG